MQQPKRSRGRPPSGPPLRIQKHIFLDEATADKLKRLAHADKESESAYIRKLIQKKGPYDSFGRCIWCSMLLGPYQEHKPDCEFLESEVYQ